MFRQTNFIAILLIALVVILSALTACAAPPSHVLQLPMPEGEFPYLWGFQDPYLFVKSIVVDVSTEGIWTLGAEQNCLSSSPHGDWLMVDRNKKGFKLLDYKQWGDKMPATAINCDVQGKSVPVLSGGFIGTKVIVFPLIIAGSGTFRRPLVQSDKGLEELSCLPESKETPICGVQTLSNGHSLVIWNEYGYEFDSDSSPLTPVAIWPLKCKPSYVDFSSVPIERDGIIYISERHLFEIHKGDREPVMHLKSVENMMAVRKGPEGAVLVQLGDNQDGDLGLIYFPADHTVIHIKPGVFRGMQYDAQSLFWSASTKKLYALSYNKIFSEDGERIMRFQRQSITP